MMFPSQKEQLKEYLGRLIWKSFEKSLPKLDNKGQEEYQKSYDKVKKENKKNSVYTIKHGFTLIANPDNYNYYVDIDLTYQSEPRNFNKDMEEESKIGIFDIDEWEDFLKLLNKMKKEDLKKHF